MTILTRISAEDQLVPPTVRAFEPDRLSQASPGAIERTQGNAEREEPAPGVVDRHDRGGPERHLEHTADIGSGNTELVSVECTAAQVFEDRICPESRGKKEVA